MLTRSQLLEYKYWVGKSPVEVRASVIKEGGWHSLFPLNQDIPVWLHRMRNFFNQTPGKLMRLGGAFRPKGYRKFITPFSLTGDAYLDPDGLMWYQMSTTATPYHYPGEVTTAKKIDAATKLQAFIPIFKLISPDDTGGSLELIVHNWRSRYLPGTNMEWGENTLGKANEWTDITYRTEFTRAYEGSYNFAETVMRGYGEHKHRDVEPHEKYGGFYVTPVHPWTKIGDRRFPAQAHQVMGRGA
jgi:hypothetical protein